MEVSKRLSGFIIKQKQRLKRKTFQTLFFFKFNNITDLTVKRITQRIQCSCVDGLSLFHPMQCVGGKPLLKYQMILCDSFFKKRFVKWRITDQYNHRINFIILNILTILNILSIMRTVHQYAKEGDHL